MKAIDILNLSVKKSRSSGSSFRNRKGRSTSGFSAHASYSHESGNVCPVCRTPMVEAKIGMESVFFCPEHRICFPQAEDSYL